LRLTQAVIAGSEKERRNIQHHGQQQAQKMLAMLSGMLIWKSPTLPNTNHYSTMD
jgi:hypothetical protein